MKVLSITATAGRHTLLERCVGMFLNQDYPDKHLLIWQNSPVPQKLDKEYDNITLVNNHISTITGERYKTLGEIYNDIIKFVKENDYLNSFDVITFSDDDDGYFPNHLSAGVKGLDGANMGVDDFYKAYKPEQSYFHHPGGVSLGGNNLEPSIFVFAKHIKKYGFSDETTAQHLQWLNPLLDEGTIFINKWGSPTLVYDWNSPVDCFKTSGNPGNPYNFENYHANSREHGDGIISPWTPEQLQPYFEYIKKKVNAV